MSSIEDFKARRMYCALNTVIQMSLDRGYLVCRPSALAGAVRNPGLYNAVDGLDFQWFTHWYSPLRQQYLADKLRVERENRKRKEEEKCSRNTLPQAERPKGGECQIPPKLKLVCKGPSTVNGLCGVTPACNEEEMGGDTIVKAEGQEYQQKEAVILAFFIEKLSVQGLHTYVNTAEEKGARSIIVVSETKVSRKLLRAACHFSSHLRPDTTEQAIRIRIFEEDELSYNITHHKSVPKHVIMGDVDIKTFLEQRKLLNTQLPRILDADPMVKYLDPPRGSIVKIERDAGGVGTYEMYRLVI